MPDFPLAVDAPRRNERSFTVTFLCAGGDTASVQISNIPVAVTGAELADVRNAVGNLSNGAVVATATTENVSIAQTLAEPLDESYSDAATKLVLVFQNADQELVTLAVPAPDESYFGTDGVTVVTPTPGGTAGAPSTILAAALTEIQVVLNGGSTGSGTYQFLRGYRSVRSRRLPRPRTARPTVEPGAGVIPGPGPGV